MGPKLCPFCGDLPEGPSPLGSVYHKPSKCVLGNTSWNATAWNARQPEAPVSSEVVSRELSIMELQSVIEPIIAKRVKHDSAQGVECPVCFLAEEITDAIIDRIKGVTK